MSSSLYRDDNLFIEIDGVEYVQKDVYDEIINDIEGRVRQADEYMKKNPPRWIGDAFEEIEKLLEDF